MRLIWKFATVVLIATCCQVAIETGIEALDEAQFAARVYVAQMRGTPVDSPELIDAGTRLIERQLEREQHRRPPTTAPAPRPTVCEADALDW